MKRLIIAFGITLVCLSCSCFEASDYPPLPDPQRDALPDIPPWESDGLHDPRPDPVDDDAAADVPLEPDPADTVEDPPPVDSLDTPAEDTADATPEEPVEDAAQDEVIEDAEDMGETDGD